MQIDLQKPVRLCGESDEDYVMRYGEAVIKANRLHTRAIDTMRDSVKPADGPKPAPRTLLERQRYNRATLIDFLSDRPDLAAKKRAGLYDPFEV